MEDVTSGIETPILATLRALARRGSTLCRQPNGAAHVQPPTGEVRARMTPQEMLHALDRGWLKQSGTEQFLLSRRGASMLRVALGQAAAEAAKRPALAPAGKSAGATPADVPDRTERPAASRRPEVDPNESPLAWLRQRRDKDGRPLISQIEFDAGERLRADFHTAGLSPRVTASWDLTTPASRQPRGAPGEALSVSEAIVAARQRIDRAMRAVGPSLSGVLIDVCCLLQGLEQAERNGGWPKRAGKVVLQIALDALARHYGLIAPSDRQTSQAARHWGAPDFRPTIDGNRTDR